MRNNVHTLTRADPVDTDMQPSCNKSVHQADIRIRSHSLSPVVWQMSGQIWKQVDIASFNTVHNFIGFVTSCPNKLVAVWWNNNIVTTCSETCHNWPVANTSCWRSCEISHTFKLLRFYVDYALLIISHYMQRYPLSYSYPAHQSRFYVD